MTAGRVLIWLAVVAAAVALVFGVVTGFEHWQAGLRADGDRAGYARCDGERKQERIKQADRAAREVATARREEQETAARAAEGEKDARDLAEARERQQAAAARRAASAAGGLSGQLAALDAAARAAGTPDAASCPGQFAQQRDAAVAARALLGACVTEYRSLAADADGALSGVELRLDTALTWIRATDAPGASELPALPHTATLQ